MQGRPPGAEELIARYAATVLHFDGGPTVDLRSALSEQARTALASWLPGEGFAVITADNPLEPLTPEEITTRRRELERACRERRADPVAVDGCAPDRSHCEASLAVALPLDEALGLAREFGQRAIFWYEAGVFSIVGALAPIGSIPLPLGGC